MLNTDAGASPEAVALFEVKGIEIRLVRNWLGNKE
jgi:hypothetical protein